jgi:hypothetical protein
MDPPSLLRAVCDSYAEEKRRSYGGPAANSEQLFVCIRVHSQLLFCRIVCRGS